jgi:hypothetical protein
MNETTNDHDQADEDVLTNYVSDAALEASASWEQWIGLPSLIPLCPPTLRFCN